MKDSYLIGNINFQFSIKLKGEEDIVYQATLKNENEDFRIYVLPDELNNLNQICRRCKHWNDVIPYFNFGEYLQTKNAQIEGKDISLDLTKARLISMGGVNGIIYFTINNYQYSYGDSNTENKTIFFLTNPSNGLVKSLGLTYYDPITKKDRPKPYNLNISNFNCTLTANLEKKHYTAIIEYSNYTEETIKKNKFFLDIVSFYYASPIEVYLSITENLNKTTIKYQQQRYNLQNSYYRNMDLAYLNFNQKEGTLIDFLKAIMIKNDYSYPYHTIICDYIRSRFLDETSKFLISYSILETLASKRDDEKFSDYLNMEECFEELYEPFAKKISFTDEEKEMPSDSQKPEGEKIKTIRWKWDELKRNLVKRPMSNSVKRLFESLNIDWNKVNKEIVDASVKNIKHITKLRNELVHNRTKDYTDNLPMKRINSKMSFAVCIVLLNKLGITEIRFHKDYPLLSIFKDV